MKESTSSKKQKTILFKTNDGVNIYVGDIYYWVHKNWSIKKEFITSEHNGNAEATGWNVLGNFANKKAAKKFVLWNKPTLALKDIAYEFGDCNAIGSLGTKMSIIVKLVKSRI